jgi:hypothetical protein
MSKVSLIRILIALFFVMLLNSCGGGGVVLIPLPNDTFDSYTTFPTAPWSVYDNSDTANWTITNSGGDKAARYNPASAGYSALLNDNFWSGFDHSVIAKIKVIGPANSGFGLMLLATGTNPNTNYYQLYINNQTAQIYFLKVVNGLSFPLGSAIAFPGGFDPTAYHTYKFSITGAQTTLATLTGTIDGSYFTITTADSYSISGSAILTWGKTGFCFNNVDDGSLTSFQVTEP